MERIEIVGLNHSTNGRSCSNHPDGCGREVQLGKVYVLKQKSLQFEYEEFTGSRTETIRELKKQDIIELCRKYELKGFSKMSKDELVNLIVKHEGGNLDEPKRKIELKTRKEVAVAVHDIQTDCIVGYIARVFVSLTGAGTLDGIFVKVLHLKANSDFDAERKESYRNGGVAVAQVVTQAFI